jgi:acetyl-CoA acetyltransferase
MTDRAFADHVAIAGVATSDFRYLYRNLDQERTPVELAVEAIHDAIADAGLDKAEIDGLVVSGIPGLAYHPVGYRTGLQNVRYMQVFGDGARGLPALLGHTGMAIMHDLASCVVLVHSLAFRSQGMTFGAPPGGGDLYDDVFGLASPGAFYAMSMSRYYSIYGGGDEQLGAVAVAFRRHATMTPGAIMGDRPMTLDDYLHSRYVAKPLRLYDYCLVNDGAVAFVLTSAERARDLKQPPVLITGVTQQGALREQYAAEDFWFESAANMKKTLLDPVGVGLDEIDTVQMYDNFSPAVIWGLEGFGWAPRGEGLDWIQHGRIELGGELPMNTSGGMLSESYLQAWNQHAEIVRQLRGQAGERQIPNCECAMYFGLEPLAGASLFRQG